MSLIHKLILVVLIVLSNHFIHAQTIHTKSFSVGDGLSQSNINCILRDSRGFLWIATQDGLNRYDGYEFKTYKHDPGDKNSISNNFINHLIEDDEGNLWIATNKGLNKYDPLKGKFTTFYKSDSNSIPQNQVFHVYEDSEGIIWIKTLHYLSKYNPENKKFRNYKHFNDYFNFHDGNNNYAILEDSSGRIWVGTKDGLNVFDKELEIFKRYYHKESVSNSLSNNSVKDIFHDKQGNIWIATANGLNKYIPGEDNFKRFYIQEEVDNPVGRNTFNFVFQDKEGIMWVGTDGGLYSFNPQDGSFNPANNLIVQNNRLLSAQVRAIEQSRSKIIWVGTLQGMVKLQKNLKDFKLYRHDEDGKPLFGDNIIASIYYDSNNKNIWVGSWNEGLYIYNKNNESVRNIDARSGLIPNNDVHSMFRDSEDRLWIGTQNGVAYYEFKTNRFIDFTSQINEANDIFKENRVYDITEDHKGNIWFGTRNGLHKYTEGELESYYHTSYNSNSLNSNFIYDLLVDSDGQIWIATDKGLNKYNENKDSFVGYKRQQMTCENCLVNNEVLTLYEDSKGYIWIGTVSGLNRFDKTHEEFVTYTEQDGLANNLIYAIQEDNHGNLWMSTNLGISKFNPDKKEFTNYSPSDGLQDFEFNHLASFKATDGEMFFGGISGMNSFYPDSIKKSAHIPKVSITSIEILTNKYRKKYDLIGKDSIIIPYKNNILTIEFTALDFAEPEKNRFAYMLKDVDNEWVNIGKRRYATFSKLSSGDYTFRLKGSNNDGVWNTEGDELHITVETPFWKNDLFYALYIIIGGLLILFIFRWRTQRLRKANQELKEREVIAQQIAKQKEELSVKNKNITDSLIYAKRIQEALLPSDYTFKSYLSNSFIFYKPKDIVSGDFYWINEKDDKIFVAVVDCTGHGVPGAFMSIIGVELLDNITNEQGVEEADKILYDLNRGIALTLSKDNETQNSIKDGMDVALCVIDKKNQTVEFAGAFRPLYLVRDNKIEEIKGDRFSVGMLEESMDSPHIKKHKFKYRKDDMIYLFTDGYADQFGGPEGKKYKYRRFRYLLLTIHKFPMDQQREYLSRSIEQWQGNHEQVDDILIVGFKPSEFNEKH
jgi:ligand-binding sensor domain-containing protein/serine phosphatase RsbU (regulator of sigma subunit)